MDKEFPHVHNRCEAKGMCPWPIFVCATVSCNNFSKRKIKMKYSNRAEELRSRIYSNNVTKGTSLENELWFVKDRS